MIQPFNGSKLSPFIYLFTLLIIWFICIIPESISVDISQNFYVSYLIHLIQQPIPKSRKVWMNSRISPTVPSGAINQDAYESGQQTGRQTNMHDSECIFAWCHPIDHHHYLLGQRATWSQCLLSCSPDSATIIPKLWNLKFEWFVLQVSFPNLLTLFCQKKIWLF